MVRHSKPHAKFLADENFPEPLGKFFKSKGLSVRPFPVRLRGQAHPDTWIIDFATKHGCILITQDGYFAQHNSLVVERIRDSLGVVNFVTPDILASDPAALYKQLIAEFSQQKIKGKVLRVSVHGATYLNPRRFH